MKFKFLIVLIFSCISQNIFSQKVISSLNLGKTEPRPLWFEYCNADKGLVTLSYMSKSSNRNIGIYKYDQDFKRVWQNQMLEQTSTTVIENLSALDESIYVMVSDQNATSKNRDYYCFQYDLDGKKIKDGKKVFTLPGKDGPEFNFEKSINKKKLLGYGIFEPDNMPSTFNYISIDGIEDTIISGSFKIPLLKNDISVKQAIITNQGNFYLLVKHQDKGKIKSPFSYQYVVYKYLTEEDKLIPYPIEIEDKFVTDLFIKADKDENLKIGGFYSNRSTDLVAGALYMKFDVNDKSPSVIAFNPFDEAFLQKYLTQKQIMKGKELSDFYLDNIILRSDGGALILAEKFYITSTSYRDMNGFWYNRNVYHYEDVWIISMGPDGKIEWTTIVNKKQSSENDIELSYVPMVGPEGVLILYKDYFKTIGTNIYYQEVDNEGNVSPSKPFFPKYYSSNIFYKNSSEQISNSEGILTIYQQKGRIFSFVKIGF